MLLTDGASNAGPEPVEAAQQAVDRGIRVYTIGFGTEDPGERPPICGAQFVGNEPGDNGDFDPFGGFFGGSGGFGGGGGCRRAIDEETLIAVAEATGGEYFPAESAQQLHEVFAQLPTDRITSHEVVEISVRVRRPRGRRSSRWPSCSARRGGRCRRGLARRSRPPGDAAGGINSRGCRTWVSGPMTVGRITLRCGHHPCGRITGPG